MGHVIIYGLFSILRVQPAAFSPPKLRETGCTEPTAALPALVFHAPSCQCYADKRMPKETTQTYCIPGPVQNTLQATTGRPTTVLSTNIDLPR